MDQVKFLTLFIAFVAFTLVVAQDVKKSIKVKADLESAASGKFLDFGSLFNKYPSYGARPGYYPSGGYYPSTGGYYPGSNYYPSSGGYPGGGYYPNSGGYYPGSSGSYPGGSGYYPSGGYYPGGTNVLGGGYGGYGGYGGNGGFNSYIGYYDRDYYGRRNLGFGYYPRTNSLGFIRGGYSLPDYVSGYRGYD